MSKDTLRMVIGFGVIVVILIVWQFVFRPKPRPQPAATPVPAETTAVDTTAAPEPAALEPEPAAPVRLTAAPAAAETTLVLENDLLRLEFTNRGGALKSALLKKYHAELVPEGATLLSTGLVLPAGPVSLGDVLLNARGDASSVTFWTQVESLDFTKTFTLEDDYTLTQTVDFEGAGIVVEAMAGIAVTEGNAKEDLTHFHFYTRSEDKVQRYSPKSVKPPRDFEEPADWVGLKNKYFFLAVVSPEPGFDSTRAAALDDGRIGLDAAVHSAGRRTEMTVYLGPLEYNKLRSFGLGFEEAVSLGWAKPIALGILWLVRFLFRIFGNWGIAIIIFAILMKAAFYPLTRTQTKQMRNMQLLQPKLNELKKKYKDNAQALNQETMQLYRLYKINPLSGCLPMLVQLPVFWALYSVLRTFIELRGAGFVLWLKDLSQPDTLFGHLPFFGNPAIGLLPVLMGVSFIAQNMLTSTDKKNWAITIIFPIFITVIFLNFPSGLQLYWFMYNVLSILESILGLKGGIPWFRKRSTREPSLATAPPPK